MPASIPQQRISILASMPATRGELVRMTGIAKSTINIITNRMLDKREVHICGVAIGYQGARLPILDVGRGADFTMPPRWRAKTPSTKVVDLDFIEAKKKMDEYMPTVLAGPKAHWASSLGVAG